MTVMKTRPTCRLSSWVLIYLVVLPCHVFAGEFNRLSREEKERGFKLLFDGKSMDQWRNYRPKTNTIRPQWQIIDEATVLTAKGGRDLISREKFGYFDLRLEYTIAERGNSGIMFRVVEETEQRNPWRLAPEYQLYDSFNVKVRGDRCAGALYGLVAAPKDLAKRPGEWNRVRILLEPAGGNKDRLRFWLNGRQTVDIIVDPAADSRWSKLLGNEHSEDHFAEEFFRAKTGHILLQDHGARVAFRNIRIRELPVEFDRCDLPQPTSAYEHPTAARATADGLIASPEPGWPQWRGPRRDGISDEKGLLSSWPQRGPKLLWKLGGLGRGWSSPIVGGGRLYVTGDVGDDLVMFAFDLDGAPIWRAKNGKAWKGSYPGARACCAFSEGRVYHVNAHGRSACLDATSGKEIWAVDILARFGAKNITWALSECLLVDGPRVIVTPGGSKALMAALDKRTGRTVWTTRPLGMDRTSHSSPILLRYAGRRLIANCSSGHGFGVDADSGRLLWTVPLKNRYGVNTATPVYGSGHVFYVTPYTENGRLYRLRASGQGMAAEHVWTCPLDTVTGGAVLVDGTLFAAGYKKSKWWFGTDWRTGQTKSQLRDFTTGAAIYADGRLYVLDESGAVGLLKPGADTMEIAGRFRLLADRVRDAWAHPVLHDGRLYLRHHDSLWCYDVRRTR